MAAAASEVLLAVLQRIWQLAAEAGWSSCCCSSWEKNKPPQMHKPGLRQLAVVSCCSGIWSGAQGFFFFFFFFPGIHPRRHMFGVDSCCDSTFAVMSTCVQGCGPQDLTRFLQNVARVQAGFYLPLASLSRSVIQLWRLEEAAIRKQHSNVWQRADPSDHQSTNVSLSQMASFPPSVSTQTQVLFMTKMF